MRRGALTISLAVLAAAFATTPASGAITLGQTQSSNTACAAPGFVDVQTKVGAGVPSYTVPPGGGVITSWQHQARDIDNAQLKFKVLRGPASPVGAAAFTVVGESGFASVPDPILYSFPIRIPVQAGDRLAVATGPNAAAAPPACNVGTATPADEVYEGPDFATGGTLNPFNTFRINVAAVMEPDADGDGYGDETQDNCKGSNGPNNGCPATKAGTGTSKKKCKKRKKKGKKGSAAAKKCGKGKKKKK